MKLTLKISLNEAVRKPSWFSGKRLSHWAIFFRGTQKMRMFKSYSEKMRYISDQHYEVIPGAQCFYCGDIFEVYDHVPPVSVWESGSNWAFKYPSCKDCNSILSSLPVRDVRVRRYFILKKLYKRHRRLLKMPEWHKIEINELSGYIKKYIEKSIIKKSYVIDRIFALSENYIQPKEMRY